MRPQAGDALSVDMSFEAEPPATQIAALKNQKGVKL
jgi:hypothetical protein